MRILNFGSLNIDHVYKVDHIVRPGETISSLSYNQFCGGKGLNQSVALARAGANVFHAGMIGPEGGFLKERLVRDGVDISSVLTTDGSSGHAIIQVDATGENSIVIHGGANQAITRAYADEVLAGFSTGDLLLLQNEISSMTDLLELASARGLSVAFNPAPFGPEVLEYPLDGVSHFIVNETEGQGLTGKAEPQAIVAAVLDRHPSASVVLTLGARGAMYGDKTGVFSVDSPKVHAVDTTAAGDTFIGFFLTLANQGREVREALALACKAGAICVTRPGAADSIPRILEVI